MVFNDIYPDFPDANTSIDTLRVPEECINAMKRLGIEYVGDMLDVYARLPLPSHVRMSSKCYSQVFRKIIALDGCTWRDEIEKWLVDWVEKN